MSLSGSPRSRCTVTVSHTLVVLRSGPSATLLRHYASRRVCQAVTCLTARRLPGHLLPYRDLLSFKRNPSRKNDFYLIAFRSPNKRCACAVQDPWKPLYITSEYAHAYVLSNNWKQRNELDLSSTKIYTRALNLIINCKNFKTFF